MDDKPQAPNGRKFPFVPLSPNNQLQPDTLDQLYRVGFPGVRYSPPSAAANPQANAAITTTVLTPSVAKAIITAGGGGGGGGVTSVGLTMPKEFVSPVSGSIGTGDVRLATAWATEPFNTVFSVPPTTSVDHNVVGTGASGTPPTLVGNTGTLPEVA